MYRARRRLAEAWPFGLLPPVFGRAFNYISENFASSEIFLHGARTPNSRPLIFSERMDVGGDTKHPKLGTVLSYNLDLIGQLPVGPVLFHLGLEANTELSFGSNGHASLNSNFWNATTNRPVWHGGVDGGGDRIEVFARNGTALMPAFFDLRPGPALAGGEEPRRRQFPMGVAALEGGQRELEGIGGPPIGQQQRQSGAAPKVAPTCSP